ncbi:MAG: PIN domain-containing protein [Actinobacteria bacterium]|nr:PIN domain-containing protein [Actinomycetota bacterium]
MNRPAEGAALPDVNVLVALAWPNHIHHEPARAWFAAHASAGWATTAITELGLVRISCNRGVVGVTTTPRAALDLVGGLRTLRGHHFWPDTVEQVTGDVDLVGGLTGHRQITDAHLVALCAAHGGHLVTFDRGITTLGEAAEVRVQLLGDCASSR